MEEVKQKKVLEVAMDLVSNAKKFIFCTHGSEEAPPQEYVNLYREKVSGGVLMKRILFGNSHETMREVNYTDGKTLVRKYFVIFRKDFESYKRMLIVDGVRAISVINGKVFLFEGKKEVEELLNYFNSKLIK